MPHLFHFLLTLSSFLVLTGMPAFAKDSFQQARQEMVQEIIEDVEETSFFINKKALSPKVMKAMSEVPRHLFVPKLLRPFAYANRPLPIGHGQTISQPYIVALMTDLLELEKSDRVLEIGTGSGYQAAVLAELVDEVYSIEIIPALGKNAKHQLKEAGYRSITTRIGDGYYGWQEHAPFDAIVVTAAASHIPPPLVQQLKNGGRMVIPVGRAFAVQQLVMVRKNQRGEITTEQILPVSFVPLTGKHE